MNLLYVCVSCFAQHLHWTAYSERMRCGVLAKYVCISCRVMHDAMCAGCVVERAVLMHGCRCSLGRQWN